MKNIHGFRLSAIVFFTCVPEWFSAVQNQFESEPVPNINSYFMSVSVSVRWIWFNFRRVLPLLLIRKKSLQALRASSPYWVSSVVDHQHIARIDEHLFPTAYTSISSTRNKGSSAHFILNIYIIPFDCATRPQWIILMCDRESSFVLSAMHLNNYNFNSTFHFVMPHCSVRKKKTKQKNAQTIPKDPFVFIINARRKCINYQMQKRNYLGCFNVEFRQIITRRQQITMNYGIFRANGWKRRKYCPSDKCNSVGVENFPKTFPIKLIMTDPLISHSSNNMPDSGKKRSFALF